jgi:hypothetical protein
MKTQPTPRRRFYIKVQVKLAIVFTVIFTVIFAAAFIWFYNYASGVAKTRINESLQNALVAGAERISGDEVIGLYEQAEPTLFSDRGDDDPDNDVYYTDDPRYWQIAEWLHTIRIVDPNAIPWIYVRADVATDPEGFYYVVDGVSLDDPLPPYTISFKEYDTAITGDLFVGLDHLYLKLDEPYEWEGAWWVSGYAPITNEAGNTVAGLGIDYKAQYVIDVENQIRNLAIPAFALTYLVAFTLVYLTSRFLSRPIVKLTEIAEKIGEGDYDQDFSGVRVPIRDEIDTLANVFEIMIEKVARREEKLKQQVAELQIQIDHSKRDEQVKEIVDNDFFQSLQSKAYEMRSRRSQQETPDTNP